MTQRRRISAGWMFAAPALILLFIYLVYPTLWTIRLSFFGGPGFIPTRFVGFDNYGRLFTQDPYFFDGSHFPPTGTAVNNVIWLFLFTSLVIIWGLIIAVMAEKVRYESIVKSVVFIPYSISATAAGIIWLFMYSPNPRMGLLNALLSAVNPNWQPINFTGDMALVTTSIIVAAVWIQTGFTTVVLSAALKGIPTDIIEAARVDGANAWQVFSRIQVPMISATISVLVVTMIIFVIKVFDLIWVMGGRQGGPQGSARVIALTQYVETFGNGKGGYGSAIAVIMMLLVIPVMIMNMRQFRREEASR